MTKEKFLYKISFKLYIFKKIMIQRLKQIQFLLLYFN